jgi:hypothetical protein
MPGLVPGIHVFVSAKKETWMAGHRRAEATPFFERPCPARRGKTHRFNFQHVRVDAQGALFKVALY